MANQPLQPTRASVCPELTMTVSNGLGLSENNDIDLQVKINDRERDGSMSSKTDVPYKLDDVLQKGSDNIDLPLMTDNTGQDEDENNQRDKVIYKLDDVPPWYLTVLFGFQVKLLVVIQYGRYTIYSRFTKTDCLILLSLALTRAPHAQFYSHQIQSLL